MDHDATIIEEDGTEVQIAARRCPISKCPGLAASTVNFAGPMNNFILAILTFIIYGLMFGVQVLNTNQIGTVLPGYPAAQAGLKSNATIRAIDGEKSILYDLSSKVSKQAGKSVTFTVKEHGKTQNVVIKPNKDGKIGVEALIEKSPARAFTYGFTKPGI